ncbi:PREDICTED: centrosomal protein of 41 kDa-like [Priapulus caudatus]|uniref:Centrosomal protein of 41 kDa-like n=1 Tax=Priapulus caudatus TaxID=37621 RepID=A0ABM1EJC7_PRICU|nr:PREDICTED: centrosomal protein of 41 kDa-like [Priapulus caudatus]
MKIHEVAGTKENGAGEIGKADGDVGNLNRTQTTKNGQTHLTDLPEEAIPSPFSLNGTLDGIGEAASPRPPAINMRPYAGLNSVIHGFGQLDLDSSGRVVETKEALREEARLQLNYRPDVTSPYLLLDVRSADTYEQSHIITAKSFPSSLLSRDRESKDNLAYKNKEGRIVIVYDEDESVACQAAHTLVQRGYSNLFLLSGGLRLASQHFPVGLTTGTVPETCLRERVRKRRPLVKASQAEFTRRDVEALQETLDRIHAPQHDTARTGRMSTMTTRSSARSIHTGSSSRSRNGAAPRRK